jgi:hypothetical protein
MAKDLLARPVVHVTVAVAVPESVLVPIFQDHVAFPSAFAAAWPRPDDSLAYPLGSITESEQLSSGLVECALSDS